jgi:hypothetical protein
MVCASYVKVALLGLFYCVITETAQFTFIVINHEILSTVIRTVPLLWHVQKDMFLAKVKATSTGKLLNSLSRNDEAAELFSSQFNVAYCRVPKGKLPTPQNHHTALSLKFSFTCKEA